MRPRLPVVLRRPIDRKMKNKNMLKWMKHNCDLTGEHATIHVFDSDPTSVGWAGFNFDGKEEVSLKPFLKRLWVIVPFFCFLTLKDFCRFLTDFSQLYLLHWGFRNCSTTNDRKKTNPNKETKDRLPLRPPLRGNTGLITASRATAPNCWIWWRSCGTFKATFCKRT